MDITPETLKKRFKENERTSPMGTTEEQRQSILQNLDNFAKKAKEKGLTFIQANQKPEEIYEMLRHTD